MDTRLRGTHVRRAVSHPRELEHQATYRAYLFGHFRVIRRDQQLLPGSAGRRKALQILQWFLLNPGKPCSADQLIDMLWPEGTADKSLSNFHVNMHALRRLLEPELGARQESSFIRRHAGKVYTFDPAGQWWTDVADLEMLHRRGAQCDREGDVRRARFYYRRVSGYVVQGWFADGGSSPWLEHYRRKYALICSQSLTRLMQLDAATGDDEELLDSAYQMLQLDRYNELAADVVIDACLRTGNRHRAHNRLATFCDGVQRDLGLSPPQRFVELRRRLEAGSPAYAGADLHGT